MGGFRHGAAGPGPGQGELIQLLTAGSFSPLRARAAVVCVDDDAGRAMAGRAVHPVTVVFETPRMPVSAQVFMDVLIRTAKHKKNRSQ